MKGSIEDILRKTALSKGVVYVGDVDQYMATDLAMDLDFLRFNGNKEVHMYITSPGGDVPAGLAIINVIRDLQAEGVVVTGEVRGEAQSMGFYILQACDFRIMHEGDALMAHGITFGFSGDNRNMKAEEKILSYWRDTVAAMVANKIQSVGALDGETASLQYWDSLMEDNIPVYFTAEEALELGLIDEIK